jgi:hypothetical protein
MSSIKVTLGSTEYEVPEMDIGQHEDISDLNGSDRKWSYLALPILMRHATPPIPDIRAVRGRPDQMRAAIEQIMRNSGYDLAPKNPQAPDQGPGQAPGAAS